MDAIRDREGNVVICGVLEHIEQAGVHSGDATLVLPPQMLYISTIRRIKKIAADVARALEITGPFNMQFLAKLNSVKVIECNRRRLGRRVDRRHGAGGHAATSRRRERSHIRLGIC